MNDLLVLKLGGSSITRKSENKFEMNEKILKGLAKEIAEAKKTKNFDLILICGVGPFGHTNVKEYNINGKIETTKQKKGVDKTIDGCNFVASEVIKALEKNGLKTKLVPGYEICKQKERKVVSFNTKPYEKALKENIIPITTGIMVKDSSWGCSVMSGDTAISETCKKMKPKKVLIGTDVGGIFDSDPKKNSNAKLIELITKKNLEKVLQNCEGSSAVDVTGGMKGKLEKLSKMIGNTPAEIFNLFEKNNLKKVLKGEEIKSTKIKL